MGTLNHFEFEYKNSYVYVIKIDTSFANFYFLRPFPTTDSTIVKEWTLSTG